MNKTYLKLIRFLIILLFVFMSCNSSDQKNENVSQLPPKLVNDGFATIKPNLSKVKVKIEYVNVHSETNYVMFAKILSSEEVGSFENMAAENSILTLKPEYTLDDNNNIKMDNEKNKKLIELKNKNTNDEIDLLISFTTKSGWRIIENLN